MKGQLFLGPALTEPGYRLVNCGSFPGMVDSAEGLAVHGEVYQVDADCLVALDEIEAVESGLYERRPVRLQPPFQETKVESYYYLGDIRDLADCGDRW